MTQIKICGLKTSSAIEAAVTAGASYVGFVFAKSPRQVTPQEVRRMTRDLPDAVQKVGVFVSPTKERAEETAELAGLDLIQIHGTTELTKLSRPIIRAFSFKDQASSYFYQYPHLLLDAPPAKLMGGNGHTFDWQLVDQRHLPKEKLWLAGGLHAGNVGEAIRYFHPSVVDVSSGVETAGEKDVLKIQQFCDAVRRVENQ